MDITKNRFFVQVDNIVHEVERDSDIPEKIAREEFVREYNYIKSHTAQKEFDRFIAYSRERHNLRQALKNLGNNTVTEMAVPLN